MRLYLSGPMTGIPKFNAPAFEDATAWLRHIGHEVISPVEEDAKTGFDAHASKDGAPVSQYGKFLGRDVEIIFDRKIEAIVVLPKWLTSRGSRLEVFCGLLLGLPIMMFIQGNLVVMEPLEVFEAIQSSLIRENKKEELIVKP